MADNKVHRSIEAPGGALCVDLFQRPDGSWGFEEYRRDAEDGRGWFPVGFHADGTYSSCGDAVAEARRRVDWLDDALSRGSC